MTRLTVHRFGPPAGAGTGLGLPVPRGDSNEPAEVAAQRMA
jgi:hypothetical protein